MHIDMLITELNPGGAERCFVNLANHLAKQGNNIRVISIGPSPVSPQLTLLEPIKNSPIELHFLDARGISDFHRTSEHLRALLKNKRPDICQSFLFHANFFAAWVYHPNQIPIVTGNRVAEPSWLRKFIGVWINQRATHVTCVSNSVAEWTHKNERTARDKITVIQNGIETSRKIRNSKTANEIRNQLGIEQSGTLSIFVGRLDVQKGIDRLAKSFDRLLDAAANHHLVFVGDGPLRKQIESEAANSSNPSRIHIVGWQPNPRDWIGASDLLLLPARYEGMPNVVLEAMAESLPVACTKAEGISELLGENADLQTARSFDTWCDLVSRLVNDKTKREALGKTNFFRCREDFDLTEKMEQYQRLYHRLLNK